MQNDALWKSHERPRTLELLSYVVHFLGLPLVLRQVVFIYRFHCSRDKQTKEFDIFMFFSQEPPFCVQFFPVSQCLFTVFFHGLLECPKTSIFR